MFVLKTSSGMQLCFVSAGSSSAASTAGCPPGRNAGFNRNLSALTELPAIRPEERSHREKTCVDSGPTTALRSKLLSHQDVPASGKEEPSVGAKMKPQPAHTNLTSSKPAYQMASLSPVDLIDVSVRSKSKELYLQRGETSKSDIHLESQRQSKPFLVQEAPVRDEKHTDWSMTSSDSDSGFQFPKLSYSERKVEPVKPFSVSAASASGIGEFGSLTPDVSDLTVYNEIAQKTPHSETFPHVKRSMRREPTPGSECDKQQGGYSRPLFSELRQRQQDSGFDSPFLPQK